MRLLVLVLVLLSGGPAHATPCRELLAGFRDNSLLDLNVEILKYRLGKLRPDFYDRFFALYARGRISKDRFERTMLKVWYLLPASARESWIRWYAAHGDEASARRIRDEIRAENPSAVSSGLAIPSTYLNTRDFLFEMLIEIGLARGLPTDLAAMLDRVEYYWARHFAEGVLRRGQARREAGEITDAQLAERALLLRTVEYRGNRQLLEPRLARALAGDSSDIDHYLTQAMYSIGPGWRSGSMRALFRLNRIGNGVGQDVFALFVDRLVQDQIEAAIGINRKDSRRQRYAIEVAENGWRAWPAVDAVSITLRWLADSPSRLNQDRLTRLHAVLGNMPSETRDFFRRIRPELLPLIEAESPAELGNLLARPEAFRPEFLRYADLIGPDLED